MDGLKDRLTPEPDRPADRPAAEGAGVDGVDRRADAAGTPWLGGGLRGRIDEAGSA